MSAEKRIADKYIARDGSNVGSQTRNREFSRAAVFAAQRRLAELMGGNSPISNKDMHSVLLAALKASPEAFGLSE